MSVRRRVGKTGVSWQVDYYDPSGKRVMKCFDLKKDAQDFAAKITVAKREGRYEDVFNVKKATQTTFNMLADKYEENFSTQKSFFRSKKHSLDVARKHFGDRKLSEITYLDFETYRTMRKATPVRETSKPRTDATVNREMALLSHMFSKAVEWGLMETSPFKKGERLIFKENNQRSRFLTETEIEDLLNACSDHLKPIVETALLTGMRRSELLSLKWEQIRNGYIYLNETKSGKPRQIPINKRLEQLFKELKHKNQLWSKYVFCDAKGNRFYDVKTAFDSACRRAGLFDFKFHDLRHTFASMLVMRGASLKAVQELLGHTTLAMTMRYSHLSQAHLKDSVSLLDSLRDFRILP